VSVTPGMVVTMIIHMTIHITGTTMIIAHMVIILHTTLEGTSTDTKGLTDETMDTKDSIDKKNEKITDGTINGTRPTTCTVHVVLFLEPIALL
jgi:hypothetical protein